MCIGFKVVCVLMEDVQGRADRGNVGAERMGSTPTQLFIADLFPRVRATLTL